MRRADRLFRIVEYLKARKSAVRARDLADLLEVSLRTIYRDMADLMASDIPIAGEAGTGYILDRDHLVKPLMFSIRELDVLALGVRMVESWSDKELAAAALSAWDKIRATLPEERSVIVDDILFSFPSKERPVPRVSLNDLHDAIRSRRIMEFLYVSEDGESSERRIRPLALAFFAPVWLLLGWCETRLDFRNFRLDRMRNLHISQFGFEDEEGKRLKDFTEREATRTQ